MPFYILVSGLGVVVVAVALVVVNLEAPELSRLCSANFTSTGEPAHIPKYKILTFTEYRLAVEYLEALLGAKRLCSCNFTTTERPVQCVSETFEDIFTIASFIPSLSIDDGTWYAEAEKRTKNLHLLLRWLKIWFDLQNQCSTFLLRQIFGSSIFLCVWLCS